MPGVAAMQSRLRSGILGSMGISEDGFDPRIMAQRGQANNGSLMDMMRGRNPNLTPGGDGTMAQGGYLGPPTGNARQAMGALNQAYGGQQAGSGGYLGPPTGAAPQAMDELGQAYGAQMPPWLGNYAPPPRRGMPGRYR